MNIKRFVAKDMRQALRDVRASLGADAVMLSSRNLEQGVEVIAAIDYDDELATEYARVAAGVAAQQGRSAETSADASAATASNEPD
ncbi:MAG: flagellar biosynthesis protein FlhF, partial [Gammaproteobacteria bacterium]|nr:flagellar biosynthesis protein FlhF [Gammaproteobacteria bacterium]